MKNQARIIRLLDDLDDFLADIVDGFTRRGEQVESLPCELLNELREIKLDMTAGLTGTEYANTMDRGV